MTGRAPADIDRDRAARAALWLAAWDGQGTHRTATAGDEAGAAWLAAEARALGAEVSIEEFALERLDPVEAYLEVEGSRIAAIPVFDAPRTDSAGIIGRLGRPEDDADIYVARLPPHMVYSGRAAGLRQAIGGRGFVVICSGNEPGMALLNAEHFREPFGTPAIHVASEVGPALFRAIARSASARLVADSRRTPARARNIVVTLGMANDRPPLVVMTPRSSWWQSVAERGGGIVSWLESLRALIAEPPGRQVVFTATGGHELGHLGLDDFLARRPGWGRPAAEGGALWVHYGANLGAAGGALSVVSPGDELRALAGAALARAGQAHAAAPKSLVPSGETRDIHRAGGRYLTLVGTNPFFHLPQDRWPNAVDLAAVVRIAAAACEVALALSAGDGAAIAPRAAPG